MLNLPMLKTPSGALIVQSGAIYRYLARHADLYGDDDMDHTNVDQVLEHLCDLQKENATMTSFEGFETNKRDFLQKSIPYYLGTLDMWIGRHRKSFAATNKLSIADLVIYEHVAGILKLYGAHALDNYTNVLRSYEAVKNDPRLAEYHKEAATMPFNVPSAHWGTTA